MTTHDDHDFQQFTGAFDGAIAPDHRFTERLRQRVNGESVATPGGDSMLVRFNVAVITALPASSRRRTWPGRARFEVAAAILLVVALLGAAFQISQPDKTNQLAFQSPESNDVEINVGGTIGRTGLLSQRNPLFGQARTAFSWSEDPGFEFPFSIPIVIGNSLVLCLQGLESNRLVNYDLKTGTIAWESDTTMGGTFASDGTHLFGFTYGNRRGETTAELIAINLADGTIAWKGPALFYRSSSGAAAVYADGIIYGADYLGNMIAANAKDGSKIWQYPAKLRVPTATETEPYAAGSYSGAQIVLSTHSALTVTLGQTIVAVDRTTGMESARVNLLDNVSAGIQLTQIQAENDRVYATAIQTEHLQSENDISGPMPTTLLAFDDVTLNQVFRTEFPDLRGLPVIADGVIFVATSFEDDGPGEIYTIDRTTGELGDPIEGVRSIWDIELSASGSTLIAISGFNVYYIDLGTHSVSSSIEVSAATAENFAGWPALMWKDSPVILSHMGEVVIIGESSSGTPPAATPAA